MVSQRAVREFAESVGFFAGAALFCWGMSNPDLKAFWMLFVIWPFMAFLPAIGPRNFRSLLLVCGAILVVAYGLNSGFTNPVGLRYIATGAGFMLSGAFLTTRTQRAFALLRCLIGAAVVLYYGAGFIWGEGLGLAGLVLSLPVAIPIVIALLVGNRAYMRAGARQEWWTWDSVEMTPSGSENSMASNGAA